MKTLYDDYTTSSARTRLAALLVDLAAIATLEGIAVLTILITGINAVPLTFTAFSECSARTLRALPPLATYLDMGQAMGSTCYDHRGSLVALALLIGIPLLYAVLTATLYGGRSPGMRVVGIVQNR